MADNEKGLDQSALHQHETASRNKPSLDLSLEPHNPASRNEGEDIEKAAITKTNVSDESSRDYAQRKQLLEVVEETSTGQDSEKGQLGNVNSLDGEGSSSRHGLKKYLHKYRIFVHLFIWLVFTGWWIAGLILHRHDLGWVVPFLLYLAITLRVIFFWVPITIVTRPMHFVWNNTGVRIAQLLPEKLKVPAGALLTIAVYLIGSFCSPESKDNTRANRGISLLGLVIFTFVLWATSANRKAIKWRTVIVGYLSQFIVALFVLRTGVGYDIFHFISTLAEDLLGFAGDGVEFLTNTATSNLGWFLVSTIPAIIFFVSIVQLLFYWGVLQWIVLKGVVFFFWLMGVSGAEAVVATASPFIGQGESAMLIRPFVPHLTTAELHQVMTSGFATIAGSVLVAYIAMGVNAQALVSSCVMSIPASIAISKLRYPETEESLTAGRVVIPEDEDPDNKSVNSLHAFAKGAWLGLKIGGTMMTNLLCIIALIGLLDGLLTWWGRYLDIEDLTIEMVVGYICYPIAFLLGVPRNGDIYKVARLIGMKLVTNEFVAYTDLQTDDYYSDLSSRSRLIVTYALCGFANVGSLGIQIGVLSQLSKRRAGDVSKIAFSALLSGALSTLTSASIAGMIVTDQAAYFESSST